MPRLLICTPSYATQGGVERILESLHQGLPGHSFEIIFGLAKGSRFHDPDRYRAEYPAIEAIDIDGTSGTQWGRRKGLNAALARTKPDVVLVSRIFDAYDAICKWKAAGHDVRLATSVISLEPEYIADIVPYAPWIDLCMTDAKLTATTIRHFSGLPEECMVSIPGGVTPARRFTAGPNGTSPLRLGYVGRLDQPQKRILDLPDILGRLSEWGMPFECTIAGSGPAEGELRSKLRERGVADRVRFLGWQSSEQLYDSVYPELDVFLHCAAWEGVTIAPREAMVHGVAPVVSDFLPSRTEGIYRHEETALKFPVGDIEEAARQIRRLHGDRELWERLSRAARDSQQGVYSRGGAIAAWAEAFRGCLARPIRRGASVPDLAGPKAGRLDRVLPPRVAEWARGILGRRFAHRDAGSEWPHCRGGYSEASLAEISRFARETEASFPFSGVNPEESR